MARTPFTPPAYQLLPPDIVDRIPRLGQTSDPADPIIHLKWFTPDSGFTWFLAEYDPAKRIAYGYVISPCPQWGTFGLDDIEHLRGSLGLPVERDLHFEPAPASQVINDS